MILPQTKDAPKVAETKVAFDPLSFLDAALLENSLEITDEMEEALAKLDQDKEAEKRHAKRLADCGKWGNWYHQHTGSRTGHFFRCGMHRECDYCLKIRAEKEYKWILDTSFDKEMVVIKRPKDNATKVLRDVKKTEYIRFPQKHVDVILMSKEAAKEKGVEGIVVDPIWVKEQDWKEMVNTPQGRNKSGTMHIPPSPKQDKKFEIISVKLFITNAPSNISNRAMDDVEDETLSMKPKNAKEVKKTIDYRTKLATTRLRQAGYSIRFYNKKLKVVESEISFGNNKSLNTGNPTLPLPQHGTIPEIPPETQ